MRDYLLRCVCHRPAQTEMHRMRRPDTHSGEYTTQKISRRPSKGDELEKGGTGLMKGKCPRCGANTSAGR